MPRLIWVFAGRTVTLLVLSCRGSYSFVASNIPFNREMLTGKMMILSVQKCTKAVWIRVLYKATLRYNCKYTDWTHRFLPGVYKLYLMNVDRIFPFFHGTCASLSTRNLHCYGEIWTISRKLSPDTHLTCFTGCDVMIRVTMIYTTSDHIHFWPNH